MNNKITFPRLATLLADKSGRSKRFSEDFLREFFTLISENLEAGENVKVKGLGTFRLTQVEPRKSVDVTTGRPMEISGHAKVSFTPAKELAEIVNSPFEAFSAIEIIDGIDISGLIQDEEEIEDEYKEDILQDSEESDSIGNLVAIKEDRSEIAEIREQIIEDNPPIVEERIHIEEQKNSIIEEKNRIIEEISSIDDKREPYFGERLSFFDDGTAEKEGPFIEDSTDITFMVEAPLEIGRALDDLQKFHSSKIDESISYDEDDEDMVTPDPFVEFPDSAHAAQTQQSGQSDVEDRQVSDRLEEENNDQFDYEPSSDEKRERLKKNIIKILMTILGAAVLGLIITFAVWYFVATSEFKKSQNIELATVTNINQLHSQKETPEETVIEETDSINDDSLLDESEEDKELEETVPTAPSDPIVYDTIGTTRYLTTMAKDHYGNYNLWPYIYEENKAKLGHPDKIRPGTPVVIPKLSKYGIDPYNTADIEKAKKFGVEIYSRYGKKI